MNARRSLLILSFVMLVVMIGYGIAMPMMPFYIEMFGVGGRELGWMSSSYALMQLLCAPLWGLLSDRWGRKPVLSIGVLGYAAAFLLYGLAQSFSVLFIARVLSGMLSSATTPSALAYISEHCAPEEKSKAMGQMGAMVGAGTILGPALGGLLSARSLALPFFAGSALALLAFLLVGAFLPEERKRRTPRRGEEESAPDAGKEKTWTLYLRVLRGPAGILLLLIFIMSFGMTNFQNMIGLYALDRFELNTQQVSSIWMVMGVMLIAVQGGLTGWLTKKIGELSLIRLGLLGGALGFGLVVLAGSYSALMAALAFFICALALIGPALNARISRYGGEHQGALMGLNSAATSLGKVLGPLWGGQLYELDIHYPFFSGAFTLLVGLALSLAGLGRDNNVVGKRD